MVALILRNREFLKINYSPCVSWPSFCFCSNVNVICSNVNLLGNINISHELYKNVWLTPYRFKTRNLIYLEFNKVNTFLFRTILLSIIDFWRKEPHINNKYMEVVTRYISVLKQKWIKWNINCVTSSVILRDVHSIRKIMEISWEETSYYQTHHI